MNRTQISEEQYRILHAAFHEELIRDEATHRWLVVGDARPDRRERERLTKRRMLDYSNDSIFDYYKLVVTDRGREAMLRYEADE